MTITAPPRVRTPPAGPSLPGPPSAVLREAVLRESVLVQAQGAFALVVADPTRHRAAVDALVDGAGRTGPPEALVLALRAQAWADRAALDHVAAGRRLDRAARLARRHGLTEPLVQVLLSRASVSLERGRSAAATADLRAAAALTSADTPELWLTHAVLLQNLGRPAEAVALYERVLRDRAGSDRARAVAANNLALIHVQSGRATLAARYLEAAGTYARDLPGLRAGVATSRAWAIMQAGRLLEAIDAFEAAVPLYTAAGIPLGEHHLEYADALADLRLLDEARAVADRAVLEFRSRGVALMAAEGELRVAHLALLAGDHAGAATAAAQAEGRLRGQRRGALAARAVVIAVQARLAESRAGNSTSTGTGTEPADLARAARAARSLDTAGAGSTAVEAHLTAGRVAAALHHTAAARRHLDRAAALAAPAPVLVRIRGRIAAGLRAELDGDGARVLTHARAGLADLDRHRAAFGSLELRVLASAHGAELGRLGLAEALREGSGARALDWMERTRAAALLAVEPVGDLGVDDDLAALRATQTELTEATAAGAADVGPLQARQREIEHRIARLTRGGRAAAARRRAAVSPAELRRALAGRVLVEYAVLDGDLLAAVVEPRRTRIVRLGPVAQVRARTDTLLFSLRRLTRPGGSAEPARRAADRCLAGLRELLVTPLGTADGVPVIAVPVGALRRVPWSALWSGPVTVAPSAAFWWGSLPERALPVGTEAANGKNGAGGADQVVLIAGPDLAGAREEVAAIRPVHDDPVVLLPPDSTARASAQALRRAGLAHLACHSRLRSDNPMFSSLQLSDGPLTLHEMGIRGIAPRRMVLAACNSAVDTGYAANEVLGFVSALIARGTAGLAASIVVVPDLAAVPLMQRLHTGLAAGRTVGDALWAARAEMDPQDPADFVSWCAFNAYGAS